jgi:hypothetical protein
MHLRQLSAGQDHPLAKVPKIFLRTTRRGGELKITLEVSGPNPVLLLTTEQERDWLATYNWYTGEQISVGCSKKVCNPLLAPPLRQPLVVRERGTRSSFSWFSSYCFPTRSR